MALHIQTHEDRQTWTDQLKLLHRLYQAAIDQIRLADESRHESDCILATETVIGAKAVLRAERLILEIVAGLDPSFGEVPEQVERLCHFCLQCLEEPDDDRLRAAAGVLTVLAEGFSEIFDEVQTLENTGQLPSRKASRGLVDQIV